MIELLKNSDIQASLVSDCEQQPSGKTRRDFRIASKEKTMESTQIVSGPRFLGVDAGTDTLKLVELVQADGGWQLQRRFRLEHGKEPQPLLDRLYREWDAATLAGAASTGRLGRQFSLTRVPLQQAQCRAFRFFFPDTEGTLVSVGSHGFSVLEIRPNGREVFRENSRCSQGTGNFLRQLTGRFSLTVEEASVLCADVERAATLSGRCQVILKTDLTHLANKGENREEILAGLFDAVCENVLNLMKPGSCPGPVVLIGGVSQSARVQRTFRDRLAKYGYELRVPGEDGLYWEALGAALLAAEQSLPAPSVEHLLAACDGAALERTPALATCLSRVRRMPVQAWAARNGCDRDLILGLDIGSTGAKAVAVDAATEATVWDAYRETQGAPVEAAQALWRQFLESPMGGEHVRGASVTGSGREIVGSLLTKCYGPDAVFIQNEIAAHAAGACHYDARVDTIFEIGGQDAKYIRLQHGRVIDCAMNEACSAGTGSFIEEQGRKFAGIEKVAQLGAAALVAPEGVSLGQHCSVFMAEIIDEAVGAGLAQNTIIAGLYDSIIQNYLNRVKGSRTVGQVIFCQGMPFAADALAAAVARQTGSEVVIPPNPGTVGALGIALLARADLAWREVTPLDLRLFLDAKVEERSTFICNAIVGCGAPGNHCRIDRLRTRVAGTAGMFTWGGACALHERATRRRKLPDRAPQPFEEREHLIADLLARLGPDRGGRRVALSDEFILKELFPYFVTFLHELGCDLRTMSGADAATLKRGIRESHVPFCAPMQLFHGVAGRLRETDADFVFAPIMRSTLRVADEAHAKVCPVVQSAPYLLRLDLADKGTAQWLSPEIEIGARGLDSPEFRASCARLAGLLGVTGDKWEHAHQAAVAAQRHFSEQCGEIGARALAFCQQQNITPVVVLGRPYTIYNPILNSNVPAILREQGAVAIPVDCYPVAADAPLLGRVYWGYAQRLLRAAHLVRRTPGVYSVYCSNYSCGPDSFNLHFFSYVMEGKPFAIIETDGHAGDAGTKTRIEAFLHCVAQDRASKGSGAAPQDLAAMERSVCDFTMLDKQAETLLVPWMGATSHITASCFRAAGFKAEALAMPNRQTLQVGRRHTSGKECVPVSLTLGRLLEKLQSNPNGRFAYMMPRTNGPCRMGMYHLLQKVVIERLGAGDRCRFVSPGESDFFAGLPPGFTTLFLTGAIAQDMLHNALLYVRPTELHRGAANEIYARRTAELYALIERQHRAIRSRAQAIIQVVTGRLFGIRRLLQAAATEFAAVHGDGVLPVVQLVGEIYVRNDAFANDGIIAKLEARGMRVRCAAVNEFFEYVDHCNQQIVPSGRIDRVISFLKERIRHVAWEAMARHLPLPGPVSVTDVAHAAIDYIAGDVGGETVLTLGWSLHNWRKGEIAAVVNVGPLECMPTRIAESQFFHAAEREGLPTLTLTFNGDPLAEDVLDNFAFEVHARHRAEKPSLKKTVASFGERRAGVPDELCSSGCETNSDQRAGNGHPLPFAPRICDESACFRWSTQSVVPTTLLVWHGEGQEFVPTRRL
jgi:predicted CoA-substrate-specific enzyme activase